MGWAGYCSRCTNKVALWSETSKESVTSRLKEKSIAGGRNSRQGGLWAKRVDCDLQRCQQLSANREQTVISADEI